MVEALESDAEFFKDRMQYCDIAHKNGAKHLAKTLNLVRALLFLFSRAGAERCVFDLGAHESYPARTT
jgi:hypothetical protein